MAATSKRLLADRDGGWICNGCGCELSQWVIEGVANYAVIDHKIPKSQGGTDDAENLWLLCNSCNSSKGQKSLEEWERSLDFNGHFFRKGFTAVPNSLLERTSLSVGARMTLICLMSFAWQGAPFPGQKRLGTMVGCTDRTIRDYLIELREQGFIRVDRRGRGKTNVYRINQQALLAGRPEKSSASENQDRKQGSVLERKQASAKEYEVEEGTSAVANATAAEVPINILVKEFVDMAREQNTEPPKRVIGQVASELKKLSAEASEPELRAALKRLLERGLHPSSLPSALFDVRQRGSTNGHDPLGELLAAHAGKWPTGTRLVRGSNGAAYVQDPLGYDTPNHAVRWVRPTRPEILSALRKDSG